MYKFKLVLPALFLSGFLITGCSSNPPVDQALIMSAEQKVQQAKDDQAYEYAPLEIKTAEKYLADAKADNSEGETIKATKNFELSVVNAEHAISKVRSEKAEKAAKEIKSGINTIRNESNK